MDVTRFLAYSIRDVGRSEGDDERIAGPMSKLPKNLPLLSIQELLLLYSSSCLSISSTFFVKRFHLTCNLFYPLG